MGIRSVRISRAALEAVAVHARETAPRECCGLLLGTADRILESVRTQNIAASPDRFEVDPKDHIQIRRQARERGLIVAGVYHSHPHSAPYPSATDLAESSYEDYLCLIVGLNDGHANARLFRLERETFAEIDLVIEA